jgi:pimeloyl-ACP methyl ester carboxylesterase
MSAESEFPSEITNEQARTLERPDGARVGYRIVRGASPRPLLALAHGMGSNMTRWSEFFRETALKASWDLLRFDMRGHGRSLWRGRVGMEIWCDDLAAILDKEGYESAVIGGNCLGANFALHFARRYPARTAGLALIEPMPPEAHTGLLRKLRGLAPLLHLAAGSIRVLNALGLYRRQLPILDLEALDTASREAVRQDPHAISRLYASPLFDLRYMPSAAYLQDLVELWRSVELRTISVPVLALPSSGRHFTDPALAEAALRALPRLTLEFIPALHWIPTEQPERMREAIERWCMNLSERFSDTGRS